MDTKELLDYVAALRDRLANERIEKDRLLRDILTSEQKREWAEIDEEFDELLESIQKQLTNGEDRLRERVLEEGKSVQGSVLQATYSPGSTKINTKKFEKFLLDNPEVMQKYPQLLECREKGNPVVSIRKAKQ